MAIFSPFGDYNEDGTPRKVSSGYSTGQRVAPTSTPVTTTTMAPVADPYRPPASAPPPPPVMPTPDGSVTPRVVPLGQTSRQPPANSAPPAAPPAYRAPPPPAATGDYGTDSQAFQGWMDSYGRFDPEVTSGRSGYRAPSAPAASAAPAYSLTYGQAQPPAAPPPPAALASPAAQAPETDDEYVRRFMPPWMAPGTAAYNMQRDAILARRTYESDPANQAAVQQQSAESNALRAAQTASMGMLVSGPMSTPVSNPAETFARFAQSGYTGAQALADGWGAGTGLPGWMGQSGYWNQLDPQGRMGAPYVNQAPLVPPPPTSATSPVPPATSSPPPLAPPAPPADPYHPAGYTPGVAAQAPVAPGAPPPAPPPPVRRTYNPTATPNIPGQPVTDFTYPVGGASPQPGAPRFGQPGQRRGVSRRTARHIWGND